MIRYFFLLITASLAYSQVGTLPTHVRLLPGYTMEPKAPEVPAFKPTKLEFKIGQHMEKSVTMPGRNLSFGPFSMVRLPNPAVFLINPMDPNYELKKLLIRPKVGIRLPRLFGAETSIGGGVSPRKVHIRVGITW